MDAARTETPRDRESVADLKATVEARRELGPDLEDHLMEAFLTRLEQRVDGRITQQTTKQSGKKSKSPKNEGVNVGVITGSFALAIPLMAIAGDVAHTAGVFAVVFGLIAVNLLYFIDRWVRFSMD